MLALLLLTVISWAVPTKHSQPRWAYQERSGIVCSPLAAELNSSPGLELVVLGRGGEITCLGADGALLWRVSGQGEFNSEPAILDLNGDGHLEIVAADREGQVTCLTGAGKLLWQRQLGGMTDWTSVVGAAAGSGYVVVPRIDGIATCLSPTGAVLWEVKLPSDCFTLPALGDVDGDGKAEVLLASSYGFLTCLAADGTVRWSIRPSHADMMGPVCADLEGDGTQEVLCGSAEGTLYACEGNSGRMRWTFSTKGPIDASISLADLDGDGRQEVICTAIDGTALCLDAQGKLRWQFATSGKVPYGPAIGDTDGDGRLEAVLADRDGFVYFLGPTGDLEHRLRVGGGMNATPVLADLEGDGRLEMVLATELGAVYGFRLGPYRGPGSLPWPTHRRDLGQTAGPAANIPGQVLPAALPRPRAATPATEPGRLELEPGTFCMGTNTARAKAKHPGRERVRLILTVTDPWAVRYTTALDSAEAALELTLDYPVLRSGRYQVRAVLEQAGSGTVLAAREAAFPVSLAEPERQLVRTAVGQVRAAADRLRTHRPQDADDLESRAYTLERRLDHLVQDARQLPGMGWQEQQALVARGAELRQQAAEWAAIASYSAGHFRAEQTQPFVVWQSNPWERLPPRAWPAAGTLSEITVTTLAGEWESVALNLSNLTSRTLALRVRPHLPTGQVQPLPWDQVTFREVTELALKQKEGPPTVFADYLPEANQAQYLLLPPWESRQVWLTLDTRGLEPGEYVLPLVVAETAPEPSGQVVPLTLRVRPVALPTENPFQSCWWSYRYWQENPKWATFDAEHYVNLFPGVGIPLGTCDDQGSLVQPPDFTVVDAYVKLRRAAGQARFLFGEPFISLRDGFDLEEVQLLGGRLVEMRPRARAMYRQWLPLVVKHLRQLGLDYGDWAFYPIDEPYRGQTCLIASLSKEAKAIDPQVRFYTDFISGHDVYDLDLVLPYIDLWCPQPDFTFRTVWGRRIARQVLASGKEMVCYGILGVSSTWKPYRLMPWQCAQYGLTGAGGWVMINQAYGMWPGDPLGGDGHSAAAGWDHPYPSKRMEAYREGVEDYLYLYLLEKLAAEAAAAGLSGEAEGARELRARAVAAVVSSDGDYDTIQHYRALLGDAIEELAGRLQRR